MPAPPRPLTIHLDARRQARVRSLAERGGISEEEAVLRAVDQVSEDGEVASMRELAGDLIGSFDGSPDLSTNKDYLRGLGERRRER